MVDLKPVPCPQWVEAYERALKDPYVAKKYDRQRRLENKKVYIDDLAPELLGSTKGLVLDIGPGPGEFLEICRFLGHEIKGIDALINDSEMGDEYLSLSSLMTERQKIPVIYEGFENLVQEGLPLEDGSTLFVNSQGSIEQVFKRHLTSEDGLTHLDHKTARRMNWVMGGEALKSFSMLFSEIYRILKSEGIFLIFANGSANNDEYDQIMRSTARRIGLEEVPVTGKYRAYTKRIHKFKKS